MSKRNFDVSVVIPCYNSATRLPATLQHLEAQITPDITWELILVDNRCTDSTAETATKLWGRIDVPLRVVKEDKQGLVHARRCGFESARGWLIIACDDDNWLCSEYVRQMFLRFSGNDKLGVACGSGEVVSDVGIPTWFCDHEGKYACGSPPNEEAVWGAGMTTKKSIWLMVEKSKLPVLLVGRTGGSLSSGEDGEYCSKVRLLGYETRSYSDLTYKHFMEPSRLSRGYLKKLYFAFGNCSVLNREYDILERKLSGKKIKFFDRLPLPLICILGVLRGWLMKIGLYNPSGAFSDKDVLQARVAGVSAQCWDLFISGRAFFIRRNLRRALAKV